MKKVTLILVFFLLLAACSSSESDEAQEVDSAELAARLDRAAEELRCIVVAERLKRVHAPSLVESFLDS